MINTIPHGIAPVRGTLEGLEPRYCIVLYCIVLYCIVLYCIVLYCIVLYCIVLYCIVLYCIVPELHFTAFRRMARGNDYDELMENTAPQSAPPPPPKKTQPSHQQHVVRLQEHTFRPAAWCRRSTTSASATMDGAEKSCAMETCTPKPLWMRPAKRMKVSESAPRLKRHSAMLIDGTPSACNAHRQRFGHIHSTTLVPHAQSAK